MTEQPDWNDFDGFVEQQIRRVSKNLLLWNGIIVVVIAILVGLLWSYLSWFFHGPQLVDDAFLLDAAKQPASGLIAYIELRDHKLTPTGYVEESTRDGKVYSTIPYYFVPVGDKLMLVKGSAEGQGQKLVGPLQSTSVPSDQQAVNSIITRNPNLRDRILPIMLNAAAVFDVFGYIFLGIITPILVLCGFNIARALIGQGKSRLHPVIRSLARQGDPLEVAREIDAEMAESSILKVGKAFLTRNWVLRPTVFRLIACRLEDIVWAYHAVIRGDNIATLAFRDGRMIGVPLHRGTPEMLERICQRVPWIEKGWDKERAKKWLRQRAAFVAEVEARRTERERN